MMVKMTACAAVKIVVQSLCCYTEAIKAPVAMSRSMKHRRLHKAIALHLSLITSLCVTLTVQVLSVSCAAFPRLSSPSRQKHR